MRVELIYSPGCKSYKKALEVLETVIAEERLPIAIEFIETSADVKPTIRINGITLSEPSHEFEGDTCGLASSSKLVGAGAPCETHLRSMLSEKWTEHTAMAV